MTTTTLTTTAQELQPGDKIIGDRSYPNGTLHLNVQSARPTINGLTIRVKALSDPYSIPRLIAYGAGETVTVRRSR